jgi:hypothetical protein
MERKSQGRRDPVRGSSSYDDDTNDKRASFRDQLELDRNDLDSAAVEQPQYAHDIGEQAVLAKSRVDELKYELEQEMAAVALDLREDSADSEKRITDKAVEAQVNMTRSVISMQKLLLRAKKEAALWGNLKEAFETRRDMLKVLTQQYASDYFTRSSTTASTGRISDRDADEARRKSGEERRKRMTTKDDD